MTAVEVAGLTKTRKDDLFHESVVNAVRSSILHGDTTSANKLLQLLPSITKKTGAKAALITYFERWGLLAYDVAIGALKHTKNTKGLTWTDGYEKELNSHHWTTWIDLAPFAEAGSDAGGAVYDADKEFRKVVSRLRKIVEDPKKVLLHAVLLSKVQELLHAYGRSDDHIKEERRGRTLFDQSTKMTSTRAGKYAKGTQL